MRKTNAELYEEAERELYGRAVRETQQEIFDDVMDLVPEENDGDRELEELESWDGETLSLQEHAASMAGHELSEHGYDRPLRMQEDLDLVQENEQLREAYDDLRGRVDAAINGPAAREAVQQRFRDQMFEQFGVLGTDDAKTEMLRSALEAVSAGASQQFADA